MAATLAQLRAGLATRLATISDVQVSAYLLGSPTPPALEVTLDDDTEYLTMGRAAIAWQFVVRAFVGAATDVGAQKKLDVLMDSAGASSVRAALEGDLTLGGVADDVTVKALRAPAIYQRGPGPAYLGCEWVVEVIAAGD